ncbi:MAG: hypothetical protein JXB25_10875, partial [Deltaproteobacteria bacterium]|nr:hypothetical protein [Deltaproteobacteria bacterium]
YHFQLYGVETPAVLEAAAGSDFSGRKPLVAALTREPFYLLSIFDLGRIVPGIPYLWQVQAFEGETGIAASHARLIYFVTPFGPAVPVGGGSAPPPGGGQP